MGNFYPMCMVKPKIETLSREIDQNTNEFVNQDLKIYSGRANAIFNLFSGFSAINTVKSTKEELKIQRINIKKSRMKLVLIWLKSSLLYFTYKRSSLPIRSKYNLVKSN